MPTRTRTSDTPEGRSLERHTGADAILKFEVYDSQSPHDGTVYRVPITNFTWTRDYTTEEIQHSGSLNPTLSTSEIRYNGSFEYEGQNPEVMDVLMHSPEQGGTIERNRPVRVNIFMEEYSHDDGDEVVSTIRFDRVLITSNDRDVTVGDVSSVTFDWEAEDMKYTRGSLAI